MKFASITSALCVAALAAFAPASPAPGQTDHQHTGDPAPAAPSQGMPSGMMQMMQMMQKMHGGALPRMTLLGGSLMAPGGAIHNVEGHIAFIKAELNLTDAQQKPWDQFADALRTNAKLLSGAPSTMMGGMMGGADTKMPLAARLGQQEKVLSLHLEALKRARAAFEGLNAVLSDEQKKQFEQLF
jgi:hypothetical protein